jgi:hypothetical protein
MRVTWAPRSLAWNAQSVAALACLAYPWLHRGAAGPTPAVEPLVVALFCVALLVLLAAASARGEVPRALVGAALAAAATIWIGSYVATGSVAPSPSAVAAWLVLTAILACAGLGKAAGGEPEAFPWTPSLFAWAWLAAGIASTVIALAQYGGAADLLGPFAAQSPKHEAYANLRQKNHYATLANIGLLCVVWLTLHGKPSLPRWLAAAATLLLCAGAAATASRAGAVQLLAVLVVAAWWHRGALSTAAWLFVPLLAYVLAAVALFYAFDPGGHGVPSLMRRLQGDVPDCPSRTVLWQNMTQLALARPWLGWGWHELSYAFYMGDFAPRFCALPYNAHNLPLHVAVELGVPAAVVLCVVCIGAVFAGRPWRVADPAKRLAWGVIMLIGMHSLVEYPLWYGPFQIALGLCLGMLLGHRPAIRMPRAALAGLGLALACIAAYVAFDYGRVRQIYLPTQARLPRYRDDTFDKVKSTWLFQDQLAFAQLARIPLNSETADQVYELSGKVLHFAPEPRVIEKRIASARLLQLDADADAEARRYLAAFPAAYAAWSSKGALRTD